ncbi:hypothetical protein NUH88_19650 [Nisaea acidiphila]|uniref:O-GlcNAc transferase C-terminal domain-containing protein n=1 Tax=Nisaea acidiphila TaxID=1862145 RepID=A0A9J7ARV3_9PROT|nr:hypothetical protein [Nisaea acidiphila]UUX49602.1 hypothetical protein NUH88_19650 [Nisaea acidiphila]
MIAAIACVFLGRNPAPCFRRASICAPEKWQPIYNRSKLLSEDEKDTVLRRALSIAPTQREILESLAASVFGRDRLTSEGSVLDQRLLAVDPASANAWSRIGNRTSKSGAPEKALAIVSRLAALPGDLRTPWKRISACLPPGFDSIEQRDRITGTLKSALTELQDAPLLPDPQSEVGVRRLFYLAYAGIEDKEFMQRFGDATIRQVSSGAFHARTGGRPSKLRGPCRVAIVSGCVGEHSVWEAIGRWWSEALRDAGIAATLYDLNGAAREQDRACFDTVVSGPKPWSEWLEIIHASGHQVLLYPEIGIDPAALFLANHRLAPIQVNSWGHPVTSGLSTIDYFVGSEFLDPPGAEGQYSETLFRMPGLGAELSEPRSAPRLKIPSGRPTAIICQSLFKFLPDFDETLRRIVETADDCRIIVVKAGDDITVQRYISRLFSHFAKHGHDPEQVFDLRERTRPEEYASLLQEADLYLDSPTFSGFNSVLHAANAGVPVLTTDARCLRARLAAAVLTALGLETDLVPQPSDYAERAAKLLGDRRRSLELGETARENLSTVWRNQNMRAPFAEFMTTVLR